MPQAVFVQDGNQIDFTSTSAVAAGAVVEVGNRVFIAKTPIAANALGALATRGIFDVVKVSGAITAGDGIHWDNDGDPVGGTAGSGAATKVAANGKFMGYAIQDAAETATTVRVLLRSMEDALAETLGLGDLADVAAVAYTAGRILVADGTKFDDVAVSGDATLSGAGVLTLAATAKPPTTAVTDPGNAGAIPVTNAGTCPIVTAGAETRTLAAPTYAGQVLVLAMKTDGGDCVITASAGINQTGNNTITLNDAGDTLVLVGIGLGAAKVWRVVVNDGCTLSTV
jgi:predicted RecA/RadA family phage recombinase